VFSLFLRIFFIFLLILLSVVFSLICFSSCMGCV
jgi:hypothetical protein